MPIASLSSTLFSHPMRLAAEEARLWLGATSPNPPVGAVALDREGKILAVAAHKRAGEAHAEAALLALCRGQDLHTVCVTLEPCNHQGRTPPCSEALIAAGVKRVVLGTSDPNPLVKGGGAERLRQAGIEVVFGVEENLCRQLIYAFAYRARSGKPWVTVKRAFTTEGSMIPPVGQKTFTSPPSIRLAHRLRKRADAILTGSGTVLADNPLFTLRSVPDFASKTRILALLDKRRRIPTAFLQQAEKNGFLPLVYDDLETAFADLTRRGVLEILVEAGPSLSEAILNGPFWTQSVTIRSGAPDKTEVAFADPSALPFEGSFWDLENMLPREKAL